MRRPQNFALSPPYILLTGTKGQLIPKSLIGVFSFLQKTNENKSQSSKIEFICSFFGGNVAQLEKIISILSDLYKANTS